jgi:RNA polymerase-binding protein DksA
MRGLTRTQLQHLEQLLLKQRQSLFEQAQEERRLVHDQTLADVAGEVPDTGDESVAMLVSDMNETMAERHVEEIRAIDAALERIRKHEIGSCRDCGADIAYARLLAFPTAARCTGCQGQHERTFAHARTPTL